MVKTLIHVQLSPGVFMPGSEEKVEIRTSKDDDSLACAAAGSSGNSMATIFIATRLDSERLIGITNLKLAEEAYFCHCSQQCAKESKTSFSQF